MKICSVCLKNDILCNACSKKIASGQVTQVDVDISRAIHKLGIDADFIRSIDAGEYFVIITDKKDSAIIIGRGGRNVKRIGTMLGKNIRIIEDSKDEKLFIERAIGAQVLGINKFYGQKEVHKIRVEGRYKSRVAPMESLVSKILGKNVKFVFE